MVANFWWILADLNLWNTQMSQRDFYLFIIDKFVNFKSS